MLRYLLLFVFTLLPFYGFAATIKGTVSEDKNASPMIGVIISAKSNDTGIDAKTKGTVTDFDGNFELSGLTPGSYELTFTYMTFITESRSVTVTNNQDFVLNVKMKAEAKELKEFTVKANKVTHTDIALVSEIRNSNSVVSGISASQITKTLDRNAADVVKRVPGVTIRDDRFIIVRGLPDRYNTVWLNDAGTPSSETDKKSFSFDIIPSGLIDRVLIFKSPSPDLPGDFAGGMAKVYTTSIQEKNELNVQFQTSSRSYTTGKNFVYNDPSSTDWLGYDDGKRSMPAAALDSARIRKNAPNANAVSKAFGNDWILKNRNASPDVRFAVSAFNIWKFKKVKLGNTVGLSYAKTATANQISRGNWDDTNLTYKLSDYLYQQNSTIGILDNIGASIGNSKFEFKNLYSQVGSAQVTVRNSVRDPLSGAENDERSYSIGYDSRANYLAQLSGTHKNDSDTRKYTWTIGYSDLFKNQPNLRRIRYAKDTGAGDSSYYSGIPSQVDILNGGRYYSQLFEHIYSFTHQFTQQFKIKNYRFDVSLGNYFEYRARAMKIRQLGYTLNRNQTSAAYGYLDINHIFQDSNVGGPNKFIIDETTNLYDEYNATNRLLASFIMAKLPIGNHLTVIGGVRYEDNIQSLKTYVNTDAVNPEVHTKFMLPSVNATYNFKQNSLIRFGYGKTLNRPEFREWSSIYFYNFDERAGTYGALSSPLTQSGSDTIKVAQIQNFDLRYEYYPSQGEMIQVGVYYKTFIDPIQRVIIPGGSGGGVDKNFSFLNAKDAYCVGAEIDVRKNLAFLDNKLNTNFLKDFTFVGNLSFTKSELNIDTTKYTSQIAKTLIQGQSPYVINLGFYYQSLQNGFQGSLLYNVFGPRMYAVGGVNNGDASIGELPFHSLDFAVSKLFAKHYILSFGIQNLLNSQIKLVEDLNADNKFDKTNDKEHQSFRPGTYYTVGVRVKI